MQSSGKTKQMIAMAAQERLNAAVQSLLAKLNSGEVKSLTLVIGLADGSFEINHTYLKSEFNKVIGQLEAAKYSLLSDMGMQKQK